MKAAEFSRGIITENFEEKDTSDRNGTEISFIPDGIFSFISNSEKSISKECSAIMRI
jgi:hypothetical protein